MTQTRVLFFLVLGLGAGCARAIETGNRPAADPRVNSAMADLRRAERELGRAHASPAVDCDRAQSLTQTICELSRRICALAQEAPRFQPECVDATARCQKATEGTAGRCALSFHASDSGGRKYPWWGGMESSVKGCRASPLPHRRS